MVVMGPATWAVLLVIGLLLVLGVLIFSAGKKPGADDPPCPGPDCGQRNPPKARFCARCGRSLRENSSG